MSTSNADPRLNPTPDYGTLGPSSDLKPTDRNPIQPGGPSARAYVVVCAGIAAGLLVAAIGKSGISQEFWRQVQQSSSHSRYSRVRTQRPTVNRELQGQAENLLQKAVARDESAKQEINSHLDEWRGKLELSDRMNSLLTAGLNSDDLEIRGATIDVDLAALNIEKTPAMVNILERQALTGPQNQRVWALWELGLLGNRGVEQDRVARILESQLHDSNADVRHWAVEGLAYLGTSDVMEPLLKVMHDDPSPMVRERAACSLAQSGMFTHEQRQSAVPTLITYAEDPSLDNPTHEWTYHALRDITGQQMPSDPAAWRNWYDSSH